MPAAQKASHTRSITHLRACEQINYPQNIDILRWLTTSHKLATKVNKRKLTYSQTVAENLNRR